MRCKRCCIKTAWLAGALLVAACAAAQSPDATAKILERLDALEKQNQAVLQEIAALREELKKQAASPAQAATSASEERAAVEQERVRDLAQTKVSASQRFPLSLSGMFLFDAFVSDGTRSRVFLQTYPDYGLGGAGGGATLRQSILGLEFRGPEVFAGGQIHGSLTMDFYARYGADDVFRVRRGLVSLDWARRSLSIGQDKPLIAPLQPTSFARVGTPPLGGAGNLWQWLPQVRYEERWPVNAKTQLKAQVGVVATDESYARAPGTGVSDRLPALDARPALQARFEWQHAWSDQTRVAAGIGGHFSQSHAAGKSVPSRVASFDLVYQPVSWLEVSSTLLAGENFANLGGMAPGVTYRGNTAIAVRGVAGWAQLALPVTRRLTFDFYAGRQLNRARDLGPFDTARTLTYAGNVLYRLAPNVVVGLEGGHSQLAYLNRLLFATDRYDATLAYLF